MSPPPHTTLPAPDRVWFFLNSSLTIVQPAPQSVASARLPGTLLSSSKALNLFLLPVAPRPNCSVRQLKPVPIRRHLPVSIDF